MIKSRPGLALAVTGTLILAVFAIPLVAHAYTTTGCSWGSSTIGLQAATLPAGYQNYSSSAATWNPMDATFVVVTSGAYTVQVQNNGANGLDGMTTWTCSGGTTIRAVSWLNSNAAQSGSLSVSARQAVWVHEFGHGLGLNHAAAGTIMYTCPRCTFINYSGRNTPQGDDINGVNSLY